MTVLESIRNRRSVRVFTDQDISEDILDQLIESLRWAPSAGNLQSRKFFFVFNDKMKKKLAAASGSSDLVTRVKKLVKRILNKNFVSQAPLVAVACLDQSISKQYGERGVLLYSIQDVAASVMNMMLVAHDLGLGSVWIEGFEENEVTETLQLPENLRPVALIPIGYPANVSVSPPRKPKGEVVEFVK